MRPPPPLATTASSTAPAPGAPYHVPPWVADDFHVERALLAGQLPLPTIDLLMDWYRKSNDGGCNTLLIRNISSLKESIERALRDAYPGRVHRDWLDHVRYVELPHQYRVRPAPSAASTGGPAEYELMEIDRPLGTGEGASHPAPPPPPSAPGRTGADAGAPPSAADPWRNRPPGMSGAPLPAGVYNWSALPGPSSSVVYTQAMRTPVMSTGAPPR